MYKNDKYSLIQLFIRKQSSEYFCIIVLVQNWSTIDTEKVYFYSSSKKFTTVATTSFTDEFYSFKIRFCIGL